jgi:hypothetical protein
MNGLRRILSIALFAALGLGLAAWIIDLTDSPWRRPASVLSVSPVAFDVQPAAPTRPAPIVLSSSPDSVSPARKERKLNAPADSVRETQENHSPPPVARLAPRPSKDIPEAKNKPLAVSGEVAAMPRVELPVKPRVELPVKPSAELPVKPSAEPAAKRHIELAVRSDDLPEQMPGLMDSTEIEPPLQTSVRALSTSVAARPLTTPQSSGPVVGQAETSHNGGGVAPAPPELAAPIPAPRHLEPPSASPVPAVPGVSVANGPGVTDWMLDDVNRRDPPTTAATPVRCCDPVSGGANRDNIPARQFP